MRTIARSLAGTVAGILLLDPAFASAAGPGQCTSESWSVEGLPLTATLCVPSDAGAHVVVGETFARNGQTLSRSLEFDVESGTDVTRAIDTVPLATIGSTKQLHLTVAYRNGRATIEHALLLPGAVVLK
jgi:hypothetical protein